MNLWIRSILGCSLLMILTSCGTVNRPTSYPELPPRPLAELLTELHAADVQIRINAVSSLADHGSAAAPAVPDLIAMIDDPLNPNGVKHVLDDESRVDVIYTLGSIGPGAVAAAPTLVTIVREPQEYTMVRQEAIWALAKIGDRTVVPQLIPVLTDPDPGFTQEVGRAIADLAQLDFSEVERKNSFTSDGTSVIADAALAWWHTEGQYLDWEHP